MRAKLAILGAVWTAMALGACHLVLGVEEKPYQLSSAVGGAASSASVGGMGGAVSSASVGGMGGAASSTTGMVGGGGGTTGPTTSSTASSTTGAGGAGGAGGSGPSTDTCGTCTGKAVNMNVCADSLGGLSSGIAWRYFDPGCKTDPNSSKHCLQGEQGCRLCRLCYPATKDNIEQGGGCNVCLDQSGQNCDQLNGKPGGGTAGEAYCPPCICELHKAQIAISFGITIPQALAMCQGNYDHCK